MSSKSGQKVYFDGKLKYAFWEEDDNPVGEGEARATLKREELSLSPELGEAVLVHLRDLDSISIKNYRIYLELSTGEKLELYHLGYRLDDMYRELVRRRNELILRDMLMQETLQKGGLKAEVTSARADKMVSDIKDKASATEVFNGEIEEKQTLCPLG